MVEDAQAEGRVALSLFAAHQGVAAVEQSLLGACLHRAPFDAIAVIVGHSRVYTQGDVFGHFATQPQTVAVLGTDLKVEQHEQQEDAGANGCVFHLLDNDL